MSTGNDVKERVRNAIDIVELIGSHVPLQRKGRGYVGLCPWHDDSRPSLQVNQERQSWRCWVCNIGGDVFSFVMQQENVQFPEALRILAEKAGIPLARSGRKIQPGSADDKQTLYAAVAWAERQYHEQLAVAHEGQQARRYLHERGITDDSIKRYRLGYAPDAWQWLLDRASGEAITSQVLVAAGLAGISDTSGRSYDRFRQRVLFPIRDTQSRPVGFGGRILPGSDDPAKYVNSPESRLFSKSNLLYGLDVVRDAVTRSRELVVVEGYTDAIMAWQHGIDNAVAVLGTALGPRHVQVIKRFADRVILVLDGDEAGQRRSNEILQLFVASPIDLRIVTLPTGADPCDFLQQHGGEAFRRRLDEADDALSYKLRVATQGIDLTKDLHRANEALEEVLVTLAQVAPSRAAVGTSQQLRHRQTLAQVARIFQLAEPDLRQRIQALRSARSEPETAESPDSEAYKTVLGMHGWDRELLQLLLRYPQFVPAALERIQPDQLRESFAEFVFEIYARMLAENVDPSFQNVMLEISDPALKTLLVELDDAAVMGDHPANLTDDEAQQPDAQRQEVPSSPREDTEPDYDPDPAECFAALIAAYEARLEKEKARTVIRKIEDGGLTEDEQLQELANLLARKRQSLSRPTDG